MLSLFSGFLSQCSSPLHHRNAVEATFQERGDNKDLSLFLKRDTKLQKHWVAIYSEAVLPFDIISCWPLSLVASKAFRCNILMRETRDEARTEKRAKRSLLVLLHHTPVHVHVACAPVWPFFHPQLASSLTSTSGINTITTIKENSIDFFHFDSEDCFGSSASSKMEKQISAKLLLA